MSLSIALTKGRLEKQTVAMLEELGYGVEALKDKGRALVFKDSVHDIQYFLVKSNDCITYVNHGVAGFLLANGALSGKDDDEIRRNILLKDKVEAIIVLPRDMFYTTDISVTLWILNMNKGAGEVNGRRVRDRHGEILFMDLRT